MERMSARSCFLGEERISMLNVESSFGEAALGLLKESGGKGRHTVYLPGNEAATDRPGLECFVGVISGLAERLQDLLPRAGRSVVAGLVVAVEAVGTGL